MPGVVEEVPVDVHRDRWAGVPEDAADLRDIESQVEADPAPG
jgi:hypothetical protein